MKSMVKVSSDVSYSKFEQMVAKKVAALKGPLFFTNHQENLFKLYLDNIPQDRQHYNCSCCRRFIDSFGGLVKVGESGQLMSAIWTDEYPTFFDASVLAMKQVVEKATITAPFINDVQIWGQPRTGEWTHLYGTPVELGVHSNKLVSAHQLAAEISQNYGIVKHALAEYTVEMIEQAIKVLEAKLIDGSEKFIENANWFHGVALMWRVTRNHRDRNHLLWRVVAMAPLAWCHIRSGMLSTLLADIKGGKTFQSIKAAWDAKMDPMQYRRSQAPPTAGNIEEGNKIIDKLGCRESMARRYATLSEVHTSWVPAVPEVVQPQVTGGFFDKLKPATVGIAPLVLPAQKMTWTLFKDTVLPKAKTLEFKTPWRGAFYGLVAPVHSDAPPIVQWNNQITWYMFEHGSSPETWCLKNGEWVTVNAICGKPCHWNGNKHDREAEAAFLVLEGAKLQWDMPGGCFFTEDLIGAMHPIRSTLEAYIKSYTVLGREQGNANGYCLQSQSTLNATLRVNGTDEYLIDRWI